MATLLAETLVVLIGLTFLRTTTCTGYGSNGNGGNGAALSRCYDCDYDPSEGQGQGPSRNGGKMMMSKSTGYQTGSRSSASSKWDGQGSDDDRRGFPRCALDRSADDQRYVRETDCQQGVCFIRKDHNGLVYRGCADPDNLPLGVDPTVQCQAQGVQPSTWWFCNGTLCNSGHFEGASGVCNVQQGPRPGAGLYGTKTGYQTPAKAKPVAWNPYAMGETSKYPSTPSSTSAADYPRPSDRMSFEQVQQNLGYSGRIPTVYGGTGMSSEQAFQVYAANENGRQSQNEYGAGNGVPPKQQSSKSPPTPDGMQKSAVYESVATPQGLTGSGRYDTGSKDNTMSPDAATKSTYSSMSASSSSGKYTPEKEMESESAADRASMPAAYKTWDFVVLAQSRLHRLRDHDFADTKQQTGSGDGGDGYRKSSSTGYDQPAAPMNYQNVAGGMSMSQYGNGNGLTDQSTSGLDTAGFEQCDGQCDSNPSGLFPDPTRTDRFIQCGPAMDAESGVACQCCRPQKMRCPRTTNFDPVTKVCSGGAAGGWGLSSTDPGTGTGYGAASY